MVILVLEYYYAFDFCIYSTIRWTIIQFIIGLRHMHFGLYRSKSSLCLIDVRCTVLYTYACLCERLNVYNYSRACIHADLYTDMPVNIMHKLYKFIIYMYVHRSMYMQVVSEH